MYLLRRLVYYLLSLGTLLRGVRNPGVLFRLLGRPGRPITLELRDGSRYLVRSLMDAWIIKETNLDCDYERMGTVLCDGWQILDIGAALGDFTVFAARRAPHGHIAAYEPSPESAELLERNLALNGAANVQVFQQAVSAEAGTVHLDVSGGVAVQFRTAGGAAGGSRRIAVTAVTLADAVSGLPGGTCDFLKMDCEGAEYDVLLGADDGVLSRIKRICLEYHDAVTRHTHVDLTQHFLGKGWRVSVYPSPVRRELGFLYFESPNAR